MATVSQLLDRVIKSTNYNDRFYIIDLFNDALSELVDAAKMEASQEYNVTPSVTEYTLPINFKAPMSLMEGAIDAPNEVYPLVNIDEYKFGYAIYSTKFHLKPEVTENKTLILYYYKYATALVEDDDTPEIDSNWHQLLANYAIGQIHLMPDSKVDKGTVDRIMTTWVQGKQSFIESQQRKRRRSSVREKVVW